MQITRAPVSRTSLCLAHLCRNCTPVSVSVSVSSHAIGFGEFAVPVVWRGAIGAGAGAFGMCSGGGSPR
jgi:hypothetical protein